MAISSMLVVLLVGMTIMPLGDSVTVGCHDHDDPTPAAYRLYLQDQLRSEEIAYDMVGPSTIGCNEPKFDLQHAGYAGEGISGITEHARSDVPTFDPDMVFLLAGTNNYRSPTTLQDFPLLYTNLFDAIGTRTAYVATVPSLGYNRPDDPNWTNKFVDRVNQVQIPLMTQALRSVAAERANVHVVEYSAQIDPAVDLMFDAIHPNKAGQRILADLFGRPR